MVSLRPSTRPFICLQCRLQLRSFRSTAQGRDFRTYATNSPKKTDSDQATKFVTKRIGELGGHDELASWYPRWRSPPRGDTIQAGRPFQIMAEDITKDGHVDDAKSQESLSIYGRVIGRRSAGSRLSFLDLQGRQGSTQVQLNDQHFHSAQDPADRLSELQRFRQTVRKGDWIVVTGSVYKSPQSQLGLAATQLPLIVSPALQPLPHSVSDPEFIARNRHVDRILHQDARDIVTLRHRLISTLRNFLSGRDFVEVNTPLLVAGASGAVARPFETVATEFSDQKLHLRIAPELWLKRLIVGNMDRVFEIGPAFRNEGVDLTHNPEFLICEFYQAMASLDNLIDTSEELLTDLARCVQQSAQEFPSIPAPPPNISKGLRRLDFIPALETAIRNKSSQLAEWIFPQLDNESSAREELLRLLPKLGIAEPASETSSLARLLDTLISELVEKDTVEPTWIIHHPECMSPLAKSFSKPSASLSGQGHRVSARAELFIKGREYINCYEEENSPVEQRRKFEEQIRHKDEETPASVDESYLSALEWGMPPTGGWGMGIDRMVMLFAGKDRIADVLPFGTLTNVVGLGTRLPSNSSKSAEADAERK